MGMTYDPSALESCERDIYGIGVSRTVAGNEGILRWVELGHQPARTRGRDCIPIQHDQALAVNLRCASRRVRWYRF